MKKTIVKLAIFFAVSLLLTGIAFAQVDCECYKITYTDLDNPAYTSSDWNEICLDYENHSGTFDGCDSSLFTGSITQGLMYGCSQYCVLFFKFHGEDNNVITGEEICGSDRFTFWGHKVASCP